MKYLYKILATGVLFVFTLLCACSTISNRQTLAYPYPPVKQEESWGKSPLEVDRDLEKQILADPREPNILMVRYQQAKLWSPIDPLKACALWQEVTKQPSFPLTKLARIRAMETCPADKDLPAIGEVISATTEPWLKEVLVRAAATRAERTGAKEQTMKLSIELADYEKIQADKIKRLQTAITLATELKNQNALTQAQNKLLEVAPRFNTDPKTTQYYQVAVDFRQARDFTNAREWYQKIVNGGDFTPVEKLKALDGIRLSYKLEKNTDQFLLATRAYSEFAREKFLVPALAGLKDNSSQDTSAALNRYVDAQVTLARALWTENTPKEATALLKKTEKDVRGLVSVDESTFTRSRIEEEAGHHAEALRILEKIDIYRIANAELRGKVLWARAWSLRKAGRYADAVTELERLVVLEGSSLLAARDHFWLGRTEKQIGQNEKATNEFNWLIQNDTLGWYGLLSYRELQKPMIPLGGPSLPRVPASDGPLIKEVSNEPILSNDDKLMMEWLLSTGENELAKGFLDIATANRRNGFDDAQTLEMLNLYARIGNYQTLFARLNELSVERKHRVIDSEPELFFPRPWKPVVDAAAKKYNVQPELVYAIMRQESAFNPLARSQADAFGLMQLIPEVASKSANSTTDLKYLNFEELYKPENNIALGSAFVRGLLDRWQNRFVPTVASYNASDKAIQNWLKTRSSKDPLEFIEDIPYEETRIYIKLVMRNFIFYQRINAGQSPIPFPEWCLADLQGIKP